MWLDAWTASGRIGGAPSKYGTDVSQRLCYPRRRVCGGPCDYVRALRGTRRHVHTKLHAAVPRRKHDVGRTGTTQSRTRSPRWPDTSFLATRCWCHCWPNEYNKHMVTSCYITPQMHRDCIFAAYVARVSISHNIIVYADCRVFL